MMHGAVVLSLTLHAVYKNIFFFSCTCYALPMSEAWRQKFCLAYINLIFMDPCIVVWISRNNQQDETLVDLQTWRTKFLFIYT